MGAEVVPRIIVSFKRAVNRDGLILEPEFSWDTGSKVRAALYALRDIGDRRALGPIGALIKYEYGKAGRAGNVILEILARGSDQQLQADARSDDTHIARFARYLLERPQELEGRRRDAKRRRAIRVRNSPTTAGCAATQQ